jgi:hypothetical protein
MPGLALYLMIAVQIALGVATYIAKYSWPSWFGDFPFAAAFVVQERSLAQSLITTAHVANGSLILFAAVVLALRSTRLFFPAASLSLNSQWRTRMSAPHARAAA